MFQPNVWSTYNPGKIDIYVLKAEVLDTFRFNMFQPNVWSTFNPGKIYIYVLKSIVSRGFDFSR